MLKARVWLKKSSEEPERVWSRRESLSKVAAGIHASLPEIIACFGVKF